MPNRYEIMREQAIADCKAGRYEDAERTLSGLLDVLRQHGAPLASSESMYWYLVARYRGDTKRAMNEFLTLRD